MKISKRVIGAGLALVMAMGFSVQVNAAENLDTTSTDVPAETEVTIVPMPEDYNNLTEEQKAIIRENEENSFTEEEIANMSPEELFKYQLLPLDESEDDFMETYGLYAAAHYGVWTKSVKQCENYYCAPASVLQALYTAGVADKISGSTDDAKQRTLAAAGKLNTDVDGATWIENIPRVLNSYTGRLRPWATYTITNDRNGKDALSYRLRSNHQFGDAVIYQLRTRYLTYYGGKDSNHYVTGISVQTMDGTYYDYGKMIIVVADPHYDSKYYGNHGVSYENLVEALYDYTSSRGPANLVW